MNETVACAHIDQPRYARGACRRCYDKWRMARRPKLNAARLAYMRKNNRRFYLRARDSRLEQFRARGGSTLDARRDFCLRQRYGISLDDYEQMVRDQLGVCAICLRPPRGKTKGSRLYIDHDHVTGKIRGLLCAGCNTALGQYLHCVATLRRAIGYLEAANAT